jgi:hypothetical protein
MIARLLLWLIVGLTILRDVNDVMMLMFCIVVSVLGDIESDVLSGNMQIR